MVGKLWVAKEWWVPTAPAKLAFRQVLAALQDENKTKVRLSSIDLKPSYPTTHLSDRRPIHFFVARAINSTNVRFALLCIYLPGGSQ